MVIELPSQISPLLFFSCSLTVIERGLAARKGAILIQGSHFGTDMILTTETLRETMDAIALTFCQVQVQRFHVHD